MQSKDVPETSSGERDRDVPETRETGREREGDRERWSLLTAQSELEMEIERDGDREGAEEDWTGGEELGVGGVRV
jgi:hypothetical protein